MPDPITGLMFASAGLQGLGLADEIFDISGSRRKAKKAEEENRKAQAWANLIRAAAGSGGGVQPIQHTPVPSMNLGAALQRAGGIAGGLAGGMGQLESARALQGYRGGQLGLGDLRSRG